MNVPHSKRELNLWKSVKPGIELIINMLLENTKARTYEKMGVLAAARMDNGGGN